MIGAIAGVLVVESVFFWERMGVDDVVGAISVHGVNGLWGVISRRPLCQRQVRRRAGTACVRAAEMDREVRRATACAGCSTATPRSSGPSCSTRPWCVVFGFVMAYVWFKFSNLITPIRVSKEVELEGLDGPEMGCLGYPDFVIRGHAADA